MVNVFAANLTGLYEKEVYDFYYEKLPVWRQAKADRIKKEDGKVQCVGAWALWQKVQVTLGLEVKVESEEEFLALPFVNLSHSGKYVLCAVSVEDGTGMISTDVKVGCDIEKIGPLRVKIAKRNFCLTEYEHILTQESEEEQKDLFYRYWVLKESFIKATREGMGRAMNSFQTIWRDGEAYKVEELNSDDAVETAMKEQNIGQQKFYYKEYRLGEEYKVAVCANSQNFRFRGQTPMQFRKF